METLMEELEKKVDGFLIAHDLLLSNEPLRALPKLIECLSYFGSHFQVPFFRMNEAEETLKQTLHLIIHKKKGS